jgi:hypothetical protein
MEFKVPHLRNAYQKVGMFGQMPSPALPAAPGLFTGDQVRSTGFLHDGSIDTVGSFLASMAFTTSTSEEAGLQAFIMAFETDMAPIVGQQVTLRSDSEIDADDRITLLIQRAGTDFVLPGNIQAKECDLIVKGVVARRQRGWRYLGGDQFQSDSATEALWSREDLENAASIPGQELTFTCMPPGSGKRAGIDRDRDKLLDAQDSAPTTPFVPRTSGDCRIAPTQPTRTSFNALFLLVLGMLARASARGRRRRRK